MNILFAASEVNPIIKVGGVADVVSSLTQEIKKFGHDIRIIIPFYKSLEEKKLSPLKKVGSLKIDVGQNAERVDIFQTRLKGEIPVYLLRNKTYLSNGGVYLDSQNFLSIARFLFFSIGALRIPKAVNWQPDVIHAHDWQTGAIPLLVRIQQSIPFQSDNRPTNVGQTIKVLFTIHNLLIQGRWGYAQILKFLGLKGDEIPSLGRKTPGIYGDDFNIMEQAILCADLITTVSPSYAKEIKTKSYQARGLNEVIQKRKQDIYGILNGLDINTFNPETDPFIKERYSIKCLSNKLIDKLALQKKSGLEQKPETPLLGVVSRLDIQKGIDLISQAADGILRLGCQFIFLGVGEKKYEDMLSRISREYPRKVVVYLKFDPVLAQQIYAGADIFLMPSRFEPCGLGQLIAMRYGTIPIVRATGGLIDTVRNARIKSDLFGLRKRVQGTGFTFVSFNVEKFIATLKGALKIYFQDKFWRQLQINAMQQDFSWEGSAEKYIELYKRLVI